MKKPLEIKHLHGGKAELRLSLGFGEQSVKARNFLAQISHLVEYNGPEGKIVVFHMNGSSLKQAVEWGLDLRTIRKKLRELSSKIPDPVLSIINNRIHSHNWQEMVPSQIPGTYSGWMSRQRPFWTRNRSIQLLWALRGFGKVINSSTLPAGMITASYHRSESWYELVTFAGFVPEEEAAHIRKVKVWTPHLIIQVIKDLHDKNLSFRPNQVRAMGYSGLLQASKSRFGSWEAAIATAGLDPYELLDWKWKLLSGDQVLSEIIKRQSQGLSLAEMKVHQDWRDLVLSGRYHFGSWREALTLAEIGPLDPTVKYTIRWSPDAVVQSLREIRSRGEPINDRNLAAYYNSLLHACRAYYGSWEAAVTAAGYIPDEERKHKRWDKDKVLSLLRSLREEGKPLNSASLQKSNPSLEAAIRQQFGTWDAGIQAAGFDPKEERLLQKRSAELVKTELSRLKAEGVPLYSENLKKNYHWLYLSARYYFGSVAKALEASGINSKEETFHSLRKRQVLEGLRHLKELGEPINSGYLSSSHSPLYLGIKRYFGSWSNAVEAAGFNPRDETITNYWSKERVVLELRKLKQQGTPIYGRYLSLNYRSLYGACSHHFESWAEAVEAAGFDPDKERRNRRVGPSEIISEIKKLKARGEPLNSAHVIRSCGQLYARGTRRFGSWEKAVKAAGYDLYLEAKRPTTIGRRTSHG